MTDEHVDELEAERARARAAAGPDERRAIVDPEPGFGAAVLDRHGIVWQRFGGGWYSTARPLFMLGPAGRKWHDLLVAGGPVTVVAPGKGDPAKLDALRELAAAVADECRQEHTRDLVDAEVAATLGTNGGGG